MPENQVLSLDLGSNSIGAVIRDTMQQNQFEKATVITFETGVGKDKDNKYTISLAANRTSKRSVRRLYQSRKYKLWAVLKALIKDKNKLYCPIKEDSLNRWKYYNKEEARKGNGGRQYPVNDVPFANWIKLDFNNDGYPDYISPYQLRKELATLKLDFSNEINRFKLGRALYHIAQHRGFKSSKIVNNKDDEKEEQPVLSEDIIIGAEKRKQEQFKREIERLGFTFESENETVGMLFARVETEGIHHPERKSEGIRIRKNLHQYITRKMLIKEVKDIFEFQQLDFNNIFGNENNKISISHSSIFWQRPLRSQKGLVGYCTLESWKTFNKKKGREIFVGKKRCPTSRPEFEEFRAWSLINNIAYREKDNQGSEWYFLPSEMRRELYQEKFFVQKDFDFFSIVKWIRQKNKHDNWEFNYNYKTTVSACIVSARLKRIFGEGWAKHVTLTDKNGKIYSASFYESIWHILFESDDQDFIEEYGRSKLKLDDEKVQQLRSLWFAMPVSYAQLSLKAINNILPFLREGFIYTDAVLLGKVPEILGDKIWNESKKFITDSLKTSVIERNREEKKILNIVNNLIAQYKARPKGNNRFADHDTSYIIGSRDAQLPPDSIERDSIQIAKAAEEGFGKEKWKKLSKPEKEQTLEQITEAYQQFFKSSQRDFYRLPRLGDAMKRFLVDNFPELLYCPNTFKQLENDEKECNCEKCKRLNKLYHPSMIAIYPKARDEYYRYDGKEMHRVMLGSPKTGAFKNPMAMRTLYELRKLVNYYIITGQIDEETRVVVEVGRELNDTNKRWAIEKYQEIRRKENEEFAAAILELLNDPEARGSLANADSDNDIDKFRLWYEMIESPEGFEEKEKFKAVEDDRTAKERKGNRKKKTVSEDENSDKDKFYEFSENHFENIKKEIWVKLKKAKDNIVEKYRLWKEQQCFCIYTGNPIRITDLFKEAVIDIEHTIPQSISFDNSLANKTVCFADYNRNIKKNKIPTELPDYDNIVNRIEAWKQKVKDLEMRVEFWKGKSKQASTPKYKNGAIREKHLWQFELDYWRNKVERFTIKEIKPGFKNNQLKDMQIISRYASHYLKSYFSHVEVQKGEVTAQFRKIFDVQETGTEKDRSRHSHHAKDAMVLSIIPVAAIRDRMLELWYKIKEEELLLKSDTEKNKPAIQERIKQLKDELSDYKARLRPKGFNNTIHQLDEIILNNNIARNRSVIPASKRVRFKGKDYMAKGDAIRGQLHKDSFLGAIQLVKKDEHGKWIKDDEGNFEFEPIKYVIREDLVYKTSSISPGFKDLKDLENQIVDKNLFYKSIKPQVESNGGDFRTTLNKGIWMLDKNGNRINKIRRVRIVLSVKEPKEIKRQTYIKAKPSKLQLDRKYKQLYYAENGRSANILCILYQKTIRDKKGNEKIDRELDIISLLDVAKLVQSGEIRSIDDLEIYRTDKNTGEVIIDANGNKEKPFAKLRPGMKVIFYETSIDQLKELNLKDLIQRVYTIIKFSGSRITFGFHLDARSDRDIKKMATEMGDKSYATGYSKVNLNKLNPRYLLSKDSLNMAIENKHFEVTPDGEIRWKY
jgi:CRISPR-associated endonuclease Csn1